MEKIKINEVILVEGKYDKIKLESLVDGIIIQINGFQIFKDKQQTEYIRRLAEQRGVLVLTDSDGAGRQLRGYLSGIFPSEQVKHAYIPDVFGKEKRKEKPSKEGKLGVEGMEPDVLRKILLRAGVSVNGDEPVKNERPITKMDLYEDGLYGGPNSTVLRKALKEKLDLPDRMSTDGLLTAINAFLSYEEYRGIVEEMTEQFNK